VNPRDIYLFYIAMGILLLAGVLLALPTMIRGPKKSTRNV